MATKREQWRGGFWDAEPGPYDGLEAWERYLVEVKATSFGPQYRAFKASLLRSARAHIALIKNFEKTYQRDEGQGEARLMNGARKREIELEYRRLKADPDVIHNTILHRHLLETWRRDSPKMWAEFQAAGPEFAERRAFVAQERMWRRSKELRDAGLPFTDAREMAEREELMLDPEPDQPEDRLDPWTPPLPACSGT